MTNGIDRRTVQGTADQTYRDVFELHHARLHRLACLLTGDVHVAEEVVAEVFAKVLPRWRAGSVDDPLAYLRRALVNEVRSRHRRRMSETRANQRWGARPVPADGSPEVAFADRSVVVALHRLPPRQRAVVVLRFHDDLSEAEVARTLGMSAGSVKSHASRGLATLRSLLERSIPEEGR